MMYLGKNAVGLATNYKFGEFSLYQKIQSTPSGATSFVVNHSLGITPKLAIIYCSNVDEPYTAEGYIQYILADGNIGVSRYWNKVNHNISIVGLIYTESDSLANAQYRFTGTDIRFYRSGSNGEWSTNTEYTIELYA